MSKRNNRSTIVNSDGLPVSFVLTTMFGRNSESIEQLSTDLLVIDQHEHMRLGGGPRDIDTMLGGALSAAIEQHRFAGELGDHIVIAQPSPRIKNILVVGLGRSGQFRRQTLCGFLRLVIETAKKLGVRRVTLPMFPGRLDEISVSGTLAVLKCRVAQYASQADGLGGLKEIEILSTPQARRWLVEGLSINEPLCHSCSNPQIT